MKKFLILIAAWATWQSTVAQEIFVKKGFFSAHEVAFERFNPITPKYTAGGYPIISTGQEYRLLSARIASSTGGGASIPIGHAVMFSERNKKHSITLNVTANLSGGAISEWVDEPCKREDFLWKRSIGRGRSEINCMSINHIVKYMLNPTGEYQQMLVWARDEGVDIAPTLLRVTFSRYGQAGGRLIYQVDINPEQYGLTRDASPHWGANGWHKDLIGRYPERVAFLERVKIWAIAVQDRLNDAFDKKHTAFDGLVDLDAHLKGNQTN